MKKELLYFFIFFATFQEIFGQSFLLEGEVDASKLVIKDEDSLFYLSTNKLNNGKYISIIDNTNDWYKWTQNHKVPAAYVDKNSNLFLYSLSSVKSQKICPLGYRLPKLNDLNDGSFLNSLESLRNTSSNYLNTDDDGVTFSVEKNNDSNHVYFWLDTIMLPKNPNEYGRFIDYNLNDWTYQNNFVCPQCATTVLCINDSTRYNLEREYSYVDLLPDVTAKFIKSYLDNNYKSWFTLP